MKNYRNPVKSLLIFISLILIIAYPFVYIGMYAGDAVISLVFGENASHGHFLEFNPHEKTSGATSPAWILLLAVIFKLLPIKIVPLAVKIINIITWYILLFLVYRLSTFFIADRSWRYITVITMGLFPGAVYNSTIGMENGLFALLATLLACLILAWKWFEEPQCYYKEFLLGVLFGIASWVRPEGIPLSLLAISYRLLLTLKPKSALTVIKHTVIFSIPLVVLVLGQGLFYYFFSGTFLSCSAKSRIIMGQLQGVRLGALPINFNFLIRLILYFPITFLFVYGICGFVKRARTRAQSSDAIRGLHGFIFLVIVFCVFFILYSSVLGAVHLARYTIFIMSFMVLIAGYGGNILWLDWHTVSIVRFLRAERYKEIFFSFVALYLLIVFSRETYIRLHLGSYNDLVYAMNAPGDREQRSRELYERLGSPAEYPIVIAAEEVQIRYFVDNRFIIRSLDGRVDPLLLDYYHDGYYDHIGYLKKRGVHYLSAFPNYNVDKKMWSLANLAGLPAGKTIIINDVVFEKNKYGYVKVTYPREKSTINNKQ